MSAPKPYTHVPITGAPSLRNAIRDYAELPSPFSRERLERAYALLARQGRDEIDECDRRVRARLRGPQLTSHLRWLKEQHLTAIADIDDALAAARQALARPLCSTCEGLRRHDGETCNTCEGVGTLDAKKEQA